MTNLCKIVLLLIINTSVYAKVYKWTDANGQTHYTDKKPEDTEITEVSINKPSTYQSAKKTDTLDYSEKVLSTQEKLDNYAKHNKKSKKKHNAKRVRCKKAKNELSKVKSTTFSNRKNLDTGAYRYLTESEKKKRDKRHQDKIRRYQEKVENEC